MVGLGALAFISSVLNVCPVFPDFSQFTAFRVLSADEFPIGMFPPSHSMSMIQWGPDESDRRVIVVGDIHGMEKPMQSVSSLARHHHQHLSDDSKILVRFSRNYHTIRGQTF
jgi:hypothetical protein